MFFGLWMLIVNFINIYTYISKTFKRIYSEITLILTFCIAYSLRYVDYTTQKLFQLWF